MKVTTRESMRPRGAVEVSCSYPGCNWAWWVDPLDSHLPNGPFDCGRDHVAERLFDKVFLQMHLETGIHWGTRRAESCCGFKEPSPEKGVALVHDRTRTKQGVLRWDRLREASELVKLISWDAKLVQETFGDPDKVEDPWQETEEAIPWAHYRLDGVLRKYTRLPCYRCRRHVAVDLYVRNMDLTQHTLSLGSYGRGVMPKPSWWGHIEVSCEMGLWAQEPQPCRLIHSPAIAEFEATTGAYWTMFTPQAALFFEPTLKRYGVIKCQEEYFLSGSVLGRNLFLGDLPKIRNYLEVMVGKEDLIYQEVSKYVE